MKTVSLFGTFKALSCRAVCAASILGALSGRAGNNWDGGGANNQTLTAANWDSDALPGSSAALTFGSVSPIGTTLVWDFGNGQNPYTITFPSGALGYTINDPATPTTIQIIQGSGGGVYNNSGNIQTLNKTVLVFYNGTKQFDANTANLVLGKDVGFRPDGMTSGHINTLSLRGACDGTINGGVINASAPAAGTAYALSKDGTGKWTLAGSGNFTGSTRITAGTLQLNHATALQSSTLDMNAADAGTLGFGSALTAATLGALQGARSITLTNATGNAVTLSVGNNASNTTYTGVLRGGGGLTKVGSGTLSLNADVAFTGAAAVNGGYLAINAVNRLATVSGITVNGGQLKATANGSYANRPATLTGNGPNSQGALHFNLNSAAITWPGSVTLSGGARLGAYSSGGSYTFSSAIGGAGGLYLWAGGASTTHTHTFVFNGACMYSGNTTIEANSMANGIAQIGVDNGLPVGTSLTLSSHFWNSTQMLAQFKLNGKKQELAGLANAGAGVQRVVNGSATASTLTVNNAAASTFSGSLGGPNANENNLALVKKGVGALTLSGSNTYTGGTTISNGTLFVNGRIAGAVAVHGGTLAGGGTVTGNVAVASGGGVNPGGSAASAGTLTVQGALALAAGATASFDLAADGTVGGGVNDLLQLTGTTGNLTLNNNPVTINILAPLAIGTPYTLITFTGTRSGTLGTVSGFGRQPVTVTYDDTPGEGKVMLTFGTSALVWNSDASSVWDVMTTANWMNPDAPLTPDVFFPFDHVTFDDTPGVQTGITLGTTVTPSTVTFNSGANAFSLSGTGKISGVATLTKDGSSTLTVSNTNDYTGATIINGGTLLLSGGPNRLPPGTAVTLANTPGAAFDLNGNNQTVASLSGGGELGGNVALGAATLTVAAVGTNTFHGEIGGSGSLAKSGNGMLTLAAANAYSGGTTVSAGTLALSGSGTLGDPAAALNATGGTLALGGTSQTAGIVTIAGGTIAEGTLTGSAFAAQSGTVSATLAGVGTVLTKTGAGTLVLSGTNTFTGGSMLLAGYVVLNSPGVSLLGDITLNNGGVQLWAAEQIADEAILAFATNSTCRLQQQGFNETVGGIQSSGGTGTRILEAASDGASNKPATLTLNVGGSGAFTFDGYVRDASGATGSPLSVTKSGTGAQTFSGSSSLVSYSGATVVNDGTLEFSGAGSVANNSAITLNGGCVKFSGSGTRSALINGAGSLICGGAITLSGTNAYTGSTALGSNATLSVTSLANGGANSSIGAASSDATNLLFDASTLSYTGPTASSDRCFTISPAKVATLSVTLTGTNLTLTGNAPATTGFLKKTGNGTLTLDPGASGYDLGALSADGGLLVLKSGTFATTGVDPAVTAYAAGIGARGGTLVVDGATVSVPGSQNLKIGANASGNVEIRSGTVNAVNFVLGHNANVSGTQSGGDVNVSYLWHYDSGVATYAMSGGTCTVRRAYNYTQFLTAPFTLLLNGGVLRAAAGTANLMDNGTKAGGVELAVQLGNVGATIDTSLSNATIVRPLNDIPGQAGRLTKIGAGTLTLTGTNTYSGATIVSNGVLRLTHAQVLPVSADVYVSSDAALQLDYVGTATIRRLYVDGELMTIDHLYGPGRSFIAPGSTGSLLTTEGAPPKGTIMLMK